MRLKTDYAILRILPIVCLQRLQFIKFFQTRSRGLCQKTLQWMQRLKLLVSFALTVIADDKNVIVDSQITFCQQLYSLSVELIESTGFSGENVVKIEQIR